MKRDVLIPTHAYAKTTATMAAWSLSTLDPLNGDRLKRQANGLRMLAAEFVTFYRKRPPSSAGYAGLSVLRGDHAVCCHRLFRKRATRHAATDDAYVTQTGNDIQIQIALAHGAKGPAGGHRELTAAGPWPVGRSRQTSPSHATGGRT